MSKYFRWAELPPRDDIHVWEGTTRWGNHDIYPIPKKEHTFQIKAFYSYYAISAVSIFGFTNASAYVSSGLGCWETVGATLIGTLFSSCNSFLGARPGIDKGLGFTMMTRCTFGLWGALLPLIVALLANLVFAGINAFYGGQAVTLIIGAVIPQFKNMSNTLPASASITTKELVGFLIYFLFYFPVVYFVPMHKLRKFLYPSVIMTGITLLGMVGWIIHANGGTGPIISSPIKLTPSRRAFLFLQAISSTAAVWSGSGDRLSDWTRFSKTRHASTPALLTGLPIMMTLTSVVGVIVTSAFYDLYGKQIWTPLGMLLYVQNLQYTPACRAGTFFAGIGLLSSQIYINIVQNSVAFGMDFVGIFPKYMSMKRGSVLVSIIALSCNPWRFLSQASIFLQILSVFAVFSSCTSALLNVDYWLVRRRKWKIPDLYHEDGIYWYTNGWNFRAVAAWILAMVPSYPGFVRSMMGGKNLLRPEYKIYQMTFFVGYPLTVLFYLTLCKIFPPAGLGIAEELEGYDTSEVYSKTVIEGVTPGLQTTIDKKGEASVDKTKARSVDESV